jgi:hypothetical protein
MTPEQSLDSKPVGFTTVFQEELEIVNRSRSRRMQPDDSPAAQGTPELAGNVYAAADSMRLIGLALSGGGIRSATFNLGVLQALAKYKVLRYIDYLSTVSGGGYIGAWLHAMVQRPASGGIHTVEEGLDPSKAKSDCLPQTALAHLRAFSNYLTPRVSVLSGDTWSLWAIWFRNTLLNLTILAAGFGTLVLAALAMSLWLACGFPICERCRIAVEVVAALFLGGAAVVLALNLAGLSGSRGFFLKRKDADGNVQLLALVPAMVSAVVLTFAMYGGPLPPVVLAGAILSALFWLYQWLSGFRETFNRLNPTPSRLKYWFLWAVVPPASGYVTAALLSELPDIMTRLGSTGGGPWPYLTVCPPAIVTILTLGLILNTGLMGRDLSDDVREWLGRLGAWATIYALGWAVVFGAACYGPAILRIVWGWASYKITAAWVIATAAGVLAGQSAKTDGPGTARSTTAALLNVVAIAGPYVFMAGFVLAISLGVHELVKYPGDSPHTPSIAAAASMAPHVQEVNSAWNKVTITVESACCLTSAPQDEAIWDRHWHEMASMVLSRALFPQLQGGSRSDSDWYRDVLHLLLMAGLATLLMSWRVDINEFSMHHFYKNRLVRCYLGASRDEELRDPNPFTDFDPDDDLRLEELLSLNDEAQASLNGPFPILNATLNLSGGRNLACQERKGASFVFTPLYCGYDGGGKTSGTSATRRSRLGATVPRAYLPTAMVARTKEDLETSKGTGIKLGTAVAISGAAASPNQGYHSSTAVAFLMTVFNVRLGWWLGNPSGSKGSKSSPALGLAYTLQELFGTADAESAFVNLSDGGHFDNLGLYELVRRRCRHIIVCDAEEDRELTFGGLAEAIRLCRTDFDVEIDIVLSGLARKPDNSPASFSGAHCAIGTIHYPADPHTQYQEATGRLIYVKASLNGREPADVLGYHTRVAEFPHESTAGQWFGESQFESYRRLGLYIGDGLFRCGDLPISAGVEPYFSRLKAL